MGEHDEAVLARIQLRLQSILDADPDQKHAVIVYFTGRVEAETLRSLGLSAMVEDTGHGRLNKASVLQLAERADVRRIEAEPEMRPSR